MKRIFLLTFLVAACAADKPTVRRLSEAELRSTNACDFRDGGSRWAMSRATYGMEVEFGRSEHELLVDLWGIATSPAGDVLLFDAGSTRVLRLDSDLRLVDTFGRDGSGPGEFSYQRWKPGDWIAADDSSIFVLDLRVLSEFDLSGEFRRYVTREIPIPYFLPARRITVRDGRILYFMDNVDRQDGTRALETWRIEATRPHTLLRTDPMPPLPRANGRVVIATSLILQGDPLWAVHRRCAFISDGAGDWILRIDLDTNRADTLHLPSREIPELAKEDEEWLEQGLRAVGMFGNVRMDEVKPTARRKWENLLVDPDGFVWLEPWRPRSMDNEPFKVWVVHPATGAADSVVVQQFPVGFLPEGAFVSRAYDRTEGLILVQKHTLELNRE